MFRKIIVKKIAEILIVSLLITTMFSSCKSQDDTKNKDKIPQHNTSGELIYDEFDSENIMLLNNEIVYIKDVDKNFKFSFYSENEYDNVNILDSSENNFDNKVVHYDENYNYNMYLIDFMNDSYVEGMNYTIELPNYNDYFLIKDIEKTNTITFTIKTDVHDKTTFNNDLDLNKTYNNIDEVGDLKEGDIALIESDEEIVPYIMSEDGENLVKAKFSDVYKSVDLYSKGNLNSNLSSESNKDLLYERIKKAIVESDLFNSLIMTSYAEGIDADIYDNINIKIDNYDGDTKVETTLNVSDGHKIVLTCIFNIGYESNVKISDATNIEKTLNFDNLDFSISLNMKEFSVKDELTVSGKQKIEDASKLISEDSKKSFLKALNLSDKTLENSKSNLFQVRVPLGGGFFIKGEVPFEAVFGYDGNLTTTFNVPYHTKTGFRFVKKTKSLQPYQEYDYNVDFNVNGEIKIKSWVGIGIKATLYALNEDMLSVNAGATVKLHNDDEFVGNINVSKPNKNANVTSSFEFTGHIKVYLTVDIYGGALMSTKPIPIIGQLFGYEVNPKFSKEVYNKVIFEKTINYNEIATISNTSIRNDKVYFYSYKIDDDTSIISSYEPDRDLRFNVMKNRAWGNAKKVIVTDPIFAESFESLFSGGNIEEVVNLRYLFSNKTKNIRSMFYKCNNLKSIDLSGFVTNSIVDCFSLFRDCKNLRYVNMSNLNMNNVNDFREVFLGCEALEEVRFDGSSFNNVKGIAYMFSGCKKIKTIDLSTFNLSNLQPVKNWTPKHITCAFANCSELETIYVSNEPDIDVIRGNRHKLIVAYDNVFIGCDKLVGGNGTSYIDIKNKYSHSFDDLDYACIDNELHEGLFTKK